MLPKTALLALFAILSACAAMHHRAASNSTLVLREKSPGLFVGHTDDGQVVIAASHYDAMNGLAVEDVDLGLEARKGGNGAMICRREVPTGSHVPHWMCRYTDDMEHERQMVLNTLQQPFLSPSGAQTGGAAIGVGSGSMGHAQQR
ncbi:MAG TPA: hypothetical protein VLW85_01450 [Myxococcales bacterium]|nr:hypothetical protein [Myxococcales bacterium]